MSESLATVLPVVMWKQKRHPTNWVTQIFPDQVLKVSLVLATCLKIQQEGDKLKETLLKMKTRLADLEASQKLHWPNDDKIKHLSIKNKIQSTASTVPKYSCGCGYKILC